MLQSEKTIIRPPLQYCFKVWQNTVRLYHTVGSPMFYNNCHNVKLYKIVKDWLWSVAYPGILFGGGGGSTNSVEIFNSFRNRVEFGTILEGLRNFGEFEPPQPPPPVSTPLVVIQPVVVKLQVVTLYMGQFKNIKYELIKTCYLYVYKLKSTVSAIR